MPADKRNHARLNITDGVNSKALPQVRQNYGQKVQK
jgi:hypothetical protein